MGISGCINILFVLCKLCWVKVEQRYLWETFLSVPLSAHFWKPTAPPFQKKKKRNQRDKNNRHASGRPCGVLGKPACKANDWEVWCLGFSQYGIWKLGWLLLLFNTENSHGHIVLVTVKAKDEVLINNQADIKYTIQRSPRTWIICLNHCAQWSGNVSSYDVFAQIFPFSTHHLFLSKLGLDSLAMETGEGDLYCRLGAARLRCDLMPSTITDTMSPLNVSSGHCNRDSVGSPWVPGSTNDLGDTPILTVLILITASSYVRVSLTTVRITMLIGTQSQQEVVCRTRLSCTLLL